MPKYISDLFTVNRRNYNLRGADLILPGFRAIRFGERSLRCYGPFLWSKVSSTLRNSSTLVSLKNKIYKETKFHGTCLKSLSTRVFFYVRHSCAFVLMGFIWLIIWFNVNLVYPRLSCYYYYYYYYYYYLIIYLFILIILISCR